MAKSVFQEIDYKLAKFEDISPSVKISEILQFYVRFTNVGIGGSQGAVVAPIGIAVIGINNYIL